jgi:hypothetical protein
LSSGGVGEWQWVLKGEASEGPVQQLIVI